MLDYAYDFWKSFVRNDRIHIDPGDELEAAYERVYGFRLPDHLYAQLLAHQTIGQAVEGMKDIIRDRMGEPEERSMTMQEQLADLGLSESDFL